MGQFSRISILQIADIFSTSRVWSTGYSVTQFWNSAYVEAIIVFNPWTLGDFLCHFKICGVKTMLCPCPRLDESVNHGKKILLPLWSDTTTCIIIWIFHWTSRSEGINCLKISLYKYIQFILSWLYCSCNC